MPRMDYVSPFDERRREPAAARAPRTGRCDGATVVLLDITKRRGDEFLDRIEERLPRARRPDAARGQGDLLQACASRR